MSGNPNLARRHPDMPVSVNGTFAKRVQSIDLNENTPLTQVDELGNQTAAGQSQDPTQLTGSIRWFPIDNVMENLFAATTGSTVDLTLLTGNVGVPIRTPKATMTACRVVSGQYSVQAPNGEFQATFNFKGGSYTEEDNSISADAPSGVGAYKSGDVSVQIGASPIAVRASGVTIRFDIPNQDLYELNNDQMVGSVLDSPKVTADVDFYESDMISGNAYPALATPADLVVKVSTVKTITMKNAVGGTKSQRGTVRGWATRRYSYSGAGDQTTLGLVIA